MDRSSFTFKGSTNDLEKRLDFKAKLAQKINSPQDSPELATVDNTFNGVSPGGKLVHPSLGEGTLVEVNHGNNEVLIDFGDKGLIGLVLSQAKSFVHSPTTGTTKGVAGNDDAFIGGEILRDKPDRSDAAYREVDFSRIVSSDFIYPEKAPIPVGVRMWHSDLGVCTVSSVNEKANTIVLEVDSIGQIDMVLSQVRSKLIPVDGSPEHVPVKPLIREPLAPRVPQYKSRGEVSVVLPEVFKIWKKEQQFMYLTRNQKLSTEQANDVFSVLSNSNPLFHIVTLAWESEDETQSKIIPGPSTPVELSQQIRQFSQWGNKRFWHPDFGECSVLSVDTKENELVLHTSVGNMPFVLDVTLPKLAIMESTTGIEHAPKRLATRQQLAARIENPEETQAAPITIKGIEDPGEEKPEQEGVAKEGLIKKLSVSLPQEFNGWTASGQYVFLTRTQHLTSEEANDVMDILRDKKPFNNKIKYEITWSE